MQDDPYPVEPQIEKFKTSDYWEDVRYPGIAKRIIQSSIEYRWAFQIISSKSIAYPFMETADSVTIEFENGQIMQIFNVKISYDTFDNENLDKITFEYSERTDKHISSQLASDFAGQFTEANILQFIVEKPPYTAIATVGLNTAPINHHFKIPTTDISENIVLNSDYYCHFSGGKSYTLNGLNPYNDIDYCECVQKDSDFIYFYVGTGLNGFVDDIQVVVDDEPVEVDRGYDNVAITLNLYTFLKPQIIPLVKNSNKITKADGTEVYGNTATKKELQTLLYVKDYEIEKLNYLFMSNTVKLITSDKTYIPIELADIAKISDKKLMGLSEIKISLKYDNIVRNNFIA
jgi:hypothetical protein